MHAEPTRETDMKRDMSIRRTLGAALVVATATACAPTWAAEAFGGNYVETSIGFTRPASVSDERIAAAIDSETDLMLALAFGTSVAPKVRFESEVAYVKVAWDIGGLGEVTGDGISVGTNLLYDIGEASSPLRFEVGLGLGWFFADEACIEGSGARVCVDADFDDWNVQALAGSSWAVSDTGAIVARYRLWHTGGFDREDRLHVFTVGYRHRFE